MSDFPTSSTPTPDPGHCDYDDWYPSFSIIPSFYILAFLVGCLGNTLVLWVYLRRPDGIRIGEQCCCCFRADRQHAPSPCKNKPSGRSNRASSHSFTSSLCPPSIPQPSRSLTDSLIASLALADLCFLVTLPLWATYTAMGYHWPFGQPLCQISSFLTALNMYASVFSLSMLSVERYRVLKGRWHSGHHPSPRGPNRTLWILVVVWVVAAVLALPGLLLRSIREVELDPKSEDDPRSVILSCQMDYSMLVGGDLEEDEKGRAEVWWDAVLSIKSTLIGFLLPLVILLFCYCSLAQLLSRHFGRGPRPDRRRQRRLLRVIVTLVMAFFLCWMPLNVNKTVYILLELGFVPYTCPLHQALLAAHPFVTCLAYLNSCLNPLLYAACDQSFREQCRATLLVWCGMCRREAEGEGRKEEHEKQQRSSTSPARAREDEEEEDKL
ncbi:apelin receptor 2 isoform X2 [Poecilia reticulata]|uniref:Apelin receptor 2 n=2 Tax=Poecilia reticulata TaxID=8081 RepID=A0A3P9Q2S1_POERE|nr:PREDICTED: apelin receptor B-like isoform X2 [Poecilia reticulata]XP_017165214.1 PREDICTED: apelin receptor B-like isoform X2 [Poecilia reticulata]